MTDQEFDLLDELYFVSSYKELLEKSGMNEPVFKEALVGLISKNFVKCLFPDQDTEVFFDPEHFEKTAQQYFFLASKEGLLAHNSR